AARGARAPPLRRVEFRADRTAHRNAGQHTQVTLQRRPGPSAGSPAPAGLEPRGEASMNCPEVRRHLPALLYGELKPDESGAIEEHLRNCLACREELAELRQLQPLLNATPAPTVRVDLPGLYRRAAARQERRLRRWRRAALASLAAAAAVVLLV